MNRRRSSHFSTGTVTYYRAGRKAREEGKTLESCPQLQTCGADSRGMLLQKSWVDGWTERDRELVEPRMAMKGAD